MPEPLARSLPGPAAQSFVPALLHVRPALSSGGSLFLQVFLAVSPAGSAENDLARGEPGMMALGNPFFSPLLGWCREVQWMWLADVLLWGEIQAPEKQGCVGLSSVLVTLGTGAVTAVQCHTGTDVLGDTEVNA